MSNIIENNAFNQCNNLKTIEIPNSIEEISTNMINDCDSIENIMGTDSIKVVDNCYLIKNGTLISVGKELSQYIIPEGVTSIGYGVFKNNLDAEYIVVPNTVTNIEAEAFRNCKNLKSITLSNTLESIGDLCFENCSSLTILHIPDSVSNVGINLLDGCTSLVDLYMSPNIDLSGNIYDIMSGVKEVIEDNLRYQGNILLGVYDNTLEHYNIKEGTIVISKNAFSNCHRMKTINIPSSVKYIQDYAFRGCKLDSINLPEGLVEIGNWAFSDSTTANSLIIPSTVKTINDYAFHGNEFTKVTILGDVKEIGRYAFSTSANIDTMVISFKSSILPIIKNDSFSINWNKGKLCIDILDELFNSNELSEEWLQYKRDGILFSNKTINDELPYISYEFNNETGLLKIMGKTNIPDYYINYGLENRPWHDFISSITSIEISDSIFYIGANAFKGCTNLKKLVIPNGITSLQPGIIANCEKIEEIVIPDSVKTIDNIYNSIAVRDNKIKINYLGGIDDWLNIDILMNDYEFINNFSLYINNQDVKEITNYTIKDGITTIKNLTFANWTSLENITIPNSVKIIEGESLNGGAFLNCKNIKNVYYKGDLSSWCNIDFGTAESNPLCYGANLYINDKEVSDITIPSNTIIKDYIFVGNKSLKSVNITNNILKIGKYAFQDCINLTNVSIPEGVISIEDNAFCGCSKLTSITIPNSVVKIGRAVFSECNNLTNLTLSNNLIVIGGYAFNGCKSLLNITIPSNVDIIDEWTFHNCINLKNVEFGDNITSIGNGSFNGCSNLTSIIIPNSVTHIGTSTFTGCKNLVNITIPDALLLNDDLCKDIIKKNTIINGEECIINDEEIIVNKRLISYLKNDTEYTIPENVTSIGKKAFYECSNLTNVIIPNSVISIDDYAFGFCTNLTSVIIPDSVVSIGKNVFSNCGKLKNITIGNGVTTIGDYAFSNCNSLVSIIFGNSVTSIGNYVFSNCTTLSNVYISNISDWCKIDFGTHTSNPLYNGAKLYINNVEIPSTLILPDDAKYIGTYAFYNCSVLKDVYIPNSVTDIAKNAFSNCINLTSITIAAKNINCDFNNCKNLESIKITDDVETISNLDIFKGCDNLKSIILGKNISNLPNLYSNKIESLTIKNKNINLVSSNFVNITPTSIRDYKIYKELYKN